MRRNIWGLLATLAGVRRKAVAIDRFHLVPAIHPDRVGDDLEPVFRDHRADHRVPAGHRSGRRQRLAAHLAAQTLRMVHLRISRITFVHPVLFRLFPVPKPETIRPRIGRIQCGVAGGAGGVVPEYGGLFGGDILWRTSVDPQGRHRCCRRLRTVRLGPVPPGDLAHHVAAGMACLYQRGNFPVPRHHAGVLFRLSGGTTTRRCAVLCVLLCRQDV